MDATIFIKPKQILYLRFYRFGILTYVPVANVNIFPIELYRNVKLKHALLLFIILLINNKAITIIVIKCGNYV